MQFACKTISLAVGAAALSLCASSAMADTVNMKFDGFDPGGVSSFTIKYGSDPSVNGNAGQFTWTVNSSTSSLYDTGDTILAWCAEIFQTVTQGLSYTYNVFADVGSYTFPDTGEALVVGNLIKLFNNHYKSVTNALTSSAMQLAIWEIIHESTGTAYDVKSGTFSVTGNNTARNLANDWLNGLDTDPKQGTYKLVAFQSDTAQDLISISEVPLPGAALMFLSALGIGGLARRKSAAAQPAEALAA